ncbi:MAG: peptidoglycan-binding protein [Clostridia bacterium]|nr:peptidoglycan-binding protein [Clostridia bacterium]
MPEFETQAQAIEKLQTYLRQLSYHDANITTPPIDGIFDTATRQSLMDFQTSRQLPPTGIADQALWELLYATYRTSLAENSPPVRMEIFPLTPLNTEYKKGDRGFVIAALQWMLRELESKFGFLQPIEVTGIFDDLTENALKSFQQQNALQPNGILDRLTWNEIADQHNVLFSGFPIE